MGIPINLNSQKELEQIGAGLRYGVQVGYKFHLGNARYVYRRRRRTAQPYLKWGSFISKIPISKSESGNAYICTMQAHNGMRPQDVVVLLKLAFLKVLVPLPLLSRELGISASEISKSIQRSRFSGLINAENQVARSSLLSFLRFGLPYVFPVRPGAPTRGVPTAISHLEIKNSFLSAGTFVWPAAEGWERGTTIMPLYEALPRFVPADPQLYYALALVEILRMGRSREKAYAAHELEKLLNA